MGVKVKVRIKETDHGLKKIMEQHQIMLQKPYVDVGILGGEHKAEQGKPITNVALARIHEYGTDTIPERSFIRSTIFENRETIVEEIKILKHEIYTGKTTVEKALTRLGLRVQALIRGKITDGDVSWPKLSPKTIARKGSDKPLIDTGQLLDSVAYKVSLKK